MKTWSLKAKQIADTSTSTLTACAGRFSSRQKRGVGKMWSSQTVEFNLKAASVDTCCVHCRSTVCSCIRDRFVDDAARQRSSRLQIRKGEQRVFSTSRTVVERFESPFRAHLSCFLEAITQHGSRCSKRFYELPLGDRAALREEIRQIIHARSVRSPPFLLFRPPTPSPVEICMHGWVGWRTH